MSLRKKSGIRRKKPHLVTEKQIKAYKARRQNKPDNVKSLPAVKSTIFWPDQVDHVKAIAMRGLTDDEMAAMLGVSPSLLESWKQFYPSFADAIENGRSVADAQVVAALHKNAIGYDYEEDVVVRGRRGAMVLKAKKHFPAETNAQKFWLSNRSPHWRGDQNTAVRIGNMPGESLKVDSETKSMVIHSILNMITPRPDGDGNPRK